MNAGHASLCSLVAMQSVFPRPAANPLHVLFTHRHTIGIALAKYFQAQASPKEDSQKETKDMDAKTDNKKTEKMTEKTNLAADGYELTVVTDSV